MRAKPKIGRILVIALIVSLVLGACGGGTTGSTWFNFPSVKLVIRENGTANLYGFNVNQVILQPAIIRQMQTANIQRLEARAGYNGIHVYLNGQDMPYIAWNAESTENLQGVIRSLPPTILPNGDLVARLLPWLRTIGLGVKLELPVAQGNRTLNISNWSGETSVRRETPGETTIGPITIASLVFDENGEAYVEGIPVSELKQMMGTTLPLRLDAGTLSILNAIGAETFRITTQPNGIDLFLNEKPLPGIAYDSRRLTSMTEVIGVFIQDPEMLALLNQIVPLLPGADVNVVVSFTGEPVAETDLGSITLVVSEDGMLETAAGIPLPSMELLPADTLGKLQDANIQQLGVTMLEDGLAITANDRVLPTISWSDESLGVLASLVAPVAGVSPQLITQGMDVVGSLGADVVVSLPVPEGVEPIEIPDEIDFTMQPPQLGDINPPTIRLSATYGDQGFTSLGGLSAETLERLGVTLPSLPPELVSALEAAGVSKLTVTTADGALNVLLDSDTALTVNYDTESLQTALDLAAPFMGESSPLADPVLDGFIREQILSIVPGANVNISVTLE
jgi:hypothetical protein